MLHRERGWDFYSERADLWKSYFDGHGKQRYRNAISGQSQPGAPPDFRGGCLADAMGLGKTLTVLSLIAANRAPGSSLGDGSSQWLRATLVVVPFSLLQLWETQIQRHFRPSSLAVLTYHGSARQTFAKRFHDYDVVITTYNSVALDYKRRKTKAGFNSSGTLFDVHWNRIILDEGEWAAVLDSRDAQPNGFDLPRNTHE